MLREYHARSRDDSDCTGRPRAELELTTAEDESRFHNYVGHQIPWYVRLIWIVFWCFAAWYVIRLLLPALDAELLSPP